MKSYKDEVEGGPAIVLGTPRRSSAYGRDPEVIGGARGPERHAGDDDDALALAGVGHSPHHVAPTESLKSSSMLSDARARVRRRRPEACTIVRARQRESSSLVTGTNELRAI
jgi:hypothetical protein